MTSVHSHSSPLGEHHQPHLPAEEAAAQRAAGVNSAYNRRHHRASTWRAMRCGSCPRVQRGLEGGEGFQRPTGSPLGCQDEARKGCSYKPLGDMDPCPGGGRHSSFLTVSLEALDFCPSQKGRGGERGGETLTSVECSVVFALMFPRAQNRG